MSLKVNQIVKVKEGFYPLYYKGEKFRIIKLNKNKDLMPVEMKSLRTKETFGFEKFEIDDEK